ncbi:hypothetical protein NPIL_85551, partial [Nephila pilipes]
PYLYFTIRACESELLHDKFPPQFKKCAKFESRFYG